MAEVQSGSMEHRPRGVTKCNKRSTRVDLTPMVDLGFLLLTFFIFTTTMATPNSLQLTMPMNSNDSMEVGKSEVMHVIVSGRHATFYYFGSEVNSMKSSTDKDLRNVIIRQKQILGLDSKGNGRLIILIKAGRDATYGEVVNLINEMLINEVGRYMLLEPSDYELEVIDRI